MPLRKTAVTIPEDVLQAVDRAARARGDSRSGYITRVLRQAVRARRDAEITRRLNELFADEELHAEQALVAEQLDAVGTDFGEDGW